jgi:hypothetical protein
MNDVSTAIAANLSLGFIRTIQCNAPVLVFPAKAGIHVCHA